MSFFKKIQDQIGAFSKWLIVLIPINSGTNSDAFAILMEEWLINIFK